jgi:hypothetical protein
MLRKTKLQFRAWEAWQEMVMMRKFLGRMSDHIAVHSAMNLVKGVYSCWTKLSAALTLHYRLQQLHALSAWHQQVQLKERQQSRLVEFASVLCARSAARALVAWSTHAASLSAKRRMFLRKQRALRDALLVGKQLHRKQRRRALAAAFEAWNARTRSRRRVQAFITPRTDSLMRAAWEVWQLTCAAARIKRQKVEVLWHLRRQERVTFQAWRTCSAALALYAAQQMASVAEHAQRSMQKLGLARWKLFMELAQLQKRQLKVCSWADIWLRLCREAFPTAATSIAGWHA